MKKIMIVGVLFVGVLFFFILSINWSWSPQQEKNNLNLPNINLPNINYANKTEVITLFRKLQNLTTNDTILLGFRLGMNKSEYQSHFKKLQSEGVITNNYRNDELNSYKTDISFSENNNTILGHGEYSLTPIFSENDTLGCLVVDYFEYWDKNTGVPYSWILNKTPNKIDLLGDTSFLNSLRHYRLVGIYRASIYKRNNTIIILDGISKTIEYWDFKVLLGELLIQMQIEEDRKSKAKSAENML